MRRPRLLTGLPVGILLLTMLACGTGTTRTPATVDTPIPLATDTSQPTQTLLPLYLSVSLGSVPLTEQGTTPIYKIDAQIPALQGSTDPRAVNFNNEMSLLVQQEISVFKDNLHELVPTPGGTGSFFGEQYNLLSGPGNILSVKIDISIYIEGAAHPSSHSRTVTYDLEAGSDVSLGQLFRTGSNYYQKLSDYCLAQLSPKISDLFTGGLDPVPDNYRSWNITPDGLLITFDEYQVAAYALGPQQVAVPYAELQVIIDPAGPLGQFLP